MSSKAILTILILFGLYDRELVANMYASGARSHCSINEHSESKINNGKIDFKKCERVYWDFYCNHNIGEPDKEECKKHNPLTH